MAKCSHAHEEVSKIPFVGTFWTFHHIGIAVCAVFAFIAIVISFSLILSHATHYSRPWEQRHIIRILLMIPIYAFVTLLSYFYYHKSIYFEVIRDCYEAFAIASFFTLLCNYIAPNLHDQKNYFREITPVNWFWPMNWMQKCTGGEQKGILRRPRSGLTWFNVVWIGIFQYCFVRVFFTIVSVITESFHLYCSTSNSPKFAHIWVLVFEGVSVTIAMYCLIQVYIQLKKDLAHHRPFLKVLCIKLVIFFCFWQSLVISFISSGGDKAYFKSTDKIAETDIQIGIPSMLLCIEMALFAVMHIFAYSAKPYKIAKGSQIGKSQAYQGGFLGLRALLDAFNPWDIVKASARGFRWLFHGHRYRMNDISYSKPTMQTNADRADLERVDTIYTGRGTELHQQTSGVMMTPLLNQNSYARDDIRDMPHDPLTPTMPPRSHAHP